MLTKEQYYYRRWFLAILFLISGLWLIYMAYGAFRFYRTIEELKRGDELPKQILIETSDGAKHKYLVLFTENKKMGSVIEENELSKMIELTGKKEFEIINYPILSKDFSNVSFEYWYWKDKLYQLKVNNSTIIKFKKGNKTMAYIILAMGIFWTGFQIWVIVTLATKGKSVYNKSFKK